MLVIGLTGGIGSGKTSVANLFAERHQVPIIDADLISRDLTQPSMPATKQIIEHFGKESELADGSLNRSYVRNIIFTQPNERAWLENLLHPLIRNAMQQQLKLIHAPYCIAVIPLLLEVEFYAFINRILVIDAPESLQIQRVKERDKTATDQINNILKSQAARDDRVARAHDVIDNSGDFAQLIPQVDKLHAQYLKMSTEK